MYFYFVIIFIKEKKIKKKLKAYNVERFIFKNFSLSSIFSLFLKHLLEYEKKKKILFYFLYVT